MRTWFNVLLLAAMAQVGFSLAQPETGEAAEAASDPITMGSRVLSASSDYGANWKADYLIDGREGSGWCSASGAPLPHTIVFELAEPAIIESSSLVNATDEPSYPGISVKRVRLEASLEGPEGPWTPVGEFEVTATPGVQEFSHEPASARWLRLTVLENHGHAEYSEFMELGLTGRYVQESREPVDISGTWSTTWTGTGGLGGATAYLQREGDRVFGTYEHSAGKLSGGFDERVMTFTWVQSDGRGMVNVALNAEGNAMQGYWWYEGELNPRGWWRFEKMPDAEPAVVEDDYLEREIADQGKVAIYGINFALDSADIQPQSVSTLERIATMMKENPEWRLNVVGHTDSQGTDSYNKDLSERRAAAVVSWLSGDGDISGERLKSEGRGESEPVASNDQALGRAANRRVELIRL